MKQLFSYGWIDSSTPSKAILRDICVDVEWDSSQGMKIERNNRNDNREGLKIQRVEKYSKEGREEGREGWRKGGRLGEREEGKEGESNFPCSSECFCKNSLMDALLSG